MATAVLTSVPNIITLCESIANFSGDTFSLEPDIKVQGGNSVSCAMTNNGVNTIAYATSFAVTNQHIRLWANFTFVGNIDTKANNGIQISVVSGSGTALYTVDGAGLGEYAGGWKQFVIYTGNTPTSGSVPSGTCTSVGFQVNTTSKPRNQPANAYFDAWYYGDGFSVTGGTSGDEIDWSHVASLDKTEAYGIVERIDDVYFFAGDVKVGNGATTTFFKSGQKVQFKDLNVSTTLYGISFQGSGCNINISGGAIGSAGTQNYFWDASDVNLNSYTMSGVQFEKSALINFKAGQSITNCVFNNCGQIDPSTSTFQDNTISNYQGSEGGALLYPNSDSNISNINLISFGTGHALELSENGTSSRSFNNLSFTGYGANNTTDSAVNYTGTSAFDLSYNGGNKPTVNPTSLVTVIDNVNTFTFNLKPAITNYEWRIYQVPQLGSLEGSVELDGQENASLSSQSYNYNYVSDIFIAVQILTQPNQDFEEKVEYFTLSNLNQNININLDLDNNN